MTPYYSALVMPAKVLTPQQKEATKRLQDIFSSKNWDRTIVAKDLGYERTIVNKYLNGTQKLSDSFLLKLQAHVKYRVSKDYVDTGVEPKFILATPHHLSRSFFEKSEAKPIDIVDETEVMTTKSGMEYRELDNGMVLMTMTLVPDYAYASYPHGWKDPEYLIELPKYSIVLPKPESGVFRAFEVRGDSMDDGTKYSISHGDVAIGRRVEQVLWDMKLFNNGGTDFVIVTHDGIICKRIIGHDIKDGIITCASRNPNKTEFPNFPIRLTEVYELYKIRKIDRDWNQR